jgi:hypothetical protein
VDIVNTYDPRNGIVYRHLDQRRDLDFRSTTSTPTVNRLPIGYANGSPSTYLRSSHRASSAA